MGKVNGLWQDTYLETLEKYANGVLTIEEGLRALRALGFQPDDAAEELNFAQLNHPKIGAVAE